MIAFYLSDTNCEKWDNKRDYIGFRTNYMLLECSHCNAWFKKGSRELTKRFRNTYEFCDKDINKFILFLRKGIYPSEYMDSLERFDETLLPDKEAYSSLNMEDIIDIDYRHANKVFKEFKLKNLGDYHDLYVKSDMLMLADIFEYLRNKSIEINELDPAHILSAPGLAWQESLRKTGIRLERLTDVDMLFILEKGIRGGICHAIYRYAKRNNKLMKNYDKNKESSYIQYLDAKNMYGLAMPQNCL